MTIQIFISYRREDTGYAAKFLHERLAQEFGRDLVFIDVDAIAPGKDFEAELQDAISRCNVFLALIGSRWLEARDKSGMRRLDDPADLVRNEIATALSLGVRSIVPVLFDGTPIPERASLPQEIRELLLRQSMTVRQTHLENDIDQLIAALKPEASKPGSPRPIAVIVGARDERQVRHLIPGNGRAEWFKDLSVGPEMVVIPAGSFLMGAPKEERGSRKNERPQITVKIPMPFAVSRKAVSVLEFGQFCRAAQHYPVGGAIYSSGGKPLFDADKNYGNPGFKQGDDHPVVCVNWYDAKAYVQWLCEKTGQVHRLLSSSEWEYACRAGTTTPYWWGKTLSRHRARWGDDGILGLPSFRRGTVPTDSFESNPWGLYQMHGNVDEWCEDTIEESYSGWPTDGSAWQGGTTWTLEQSPLRTIRGGAWNHNANVLRSAYRSGTFATERNNEIGFRVARTL